MWNDDQKSGAADNALTPRLISTLYMESMLLADEARGYFDDGGRAERDGLAALERVNYSCESLKVTTRLMHVIAWLLTRRAVAAGELTDAEGVQPSRRLGGAPVSEPHAVAMLPERAHLLVASSIDLYDRVARLDEGLGQKNVPSPARTLMNRLEAAF